MQQTNKNKKITTFNKSVVNFEYVLEYDSDGTQRVFWDNHQTAVYDYESHLCSKVFHRTHTLWRVCSRTQTQNVQFMHTVCTTNRLHGGLFKWNALKRVSFYMCVRINVRNTKANKRATNVVLMCKRKTRFKQQYHQHHKHRNKSLTITKTTRNIKYKIKKKYNK